MFFFGVAHAREAWRSVFAVLELLDFTQLPCPSEHGRSHVLMCEGLAEPEQWWESIFFWDKMNVIVLPPATVNLPWALSPSRHYSGPITVGAHIPHVTGHCADLTFAPQGYTQASSEINIPVR